MSTSVMELKLPKATEFNDVFLGQLLESTQEQKLVCHPENADLLQNMRNSAASQVVELKMPSTEAEEWRFTDLKELKEQDFQPANGIFTSDMADMARFILPETAHSHLVFVNGSYAANLSDISGLPEGVYVGNLAELPKEKKRENCSVFFSGKARSIYRFKYCQYH